MNAFEHIDAIEGRIYNKVNGIGFELYTTAKSAMDNSQLIGTQASLAQNAND